MTFASRVIRGGLPVILLTASAALASCSTVTYGTGTGTTAQTVMDITRMFSLVNRREAIQYEPRPGLQTPDTIALPPPTPAGQTQATQPVQQPVAVADANGCVVGPGVGALPEAICAATPAAGIRTLTNACVWWGIDWAEMNAEERDAWGRLGWDATNWRSLDPELWPNSAGKFWDDLRRRERNAASDLGFNEAVWDSCYNV